MALVGTIIAMRRTITVLFDAITPAAQTLHETQGAIAEFGSSINMRIGKDDQADVLESAVDIYAKGRGRKVYDEIGITRVVEPTVGVRAVGVLAKERHLLNYVRVG